MPTILAALFVGTFAAAPPEPTVAIAPGPWMMLDTRHIVLADGVQSTWFDPAAFGTPQSGATGPGIWLPPIASALPESARQLLETPLVLVTADPSARCPVTIKTLWVASVAVFDDHEGAAFYRALGEPGTDGLELTAAERAAKAWQVGHRLLVGEVAPVGTEACEGPLFAARAAAVPKQLKVAKAAPALKAKALKALRASAFWDIQQDAYLKSIVVARVHYRAQIDEERKRQIADGTKPNRVDVSYIHDPTRGAPKTWDTPVRGEGRPEVESVSDADGALRFVRVRAGNNLSCAAPAAWAVFDASLGLVDFGLAPRAQLFVDWDGDGSMDLFESGWRWGRARALEQPGQGTIASLEIQPSGLSCYWEQIGPLPREPDAAPKPP